MGLILGIGIPVVLILFLIFFFVGTYNRLVDLRNRVKNAFAQIDTQLRRKHDLIPNLVETAKSYMAHEKEVFVGVTEARNGAVRAEKEAAEDPANPDNMKKLVKAEGALAKSMRGFYAVMENYPDVKANTNMQQLSQELTNTENKIAFARQAFNDSVMFYNTNRQKFPAVAVAGMLGFKDAEPFEITEDEREQRLKVSF